MTEIHKYVIQSLVERSQITSEKLIRALESLIDQAYVEVILQELVKEDKREEPMCNNFPKVRLVSPGNSKLQVIKIIKEACDLGLKEAKDLVDSVPSILPDSDNNEKLFLNLQDSGAIVRLVEECK